MAAFCLALKHSHSFVITNGVGWLITFIGKMTISLGNTFLGYMFVMWFTTMGDDVKNASPAPPVAVIFIYSYLLAAVFMSVFSTTSLAILQCLYADVDICNQNREDQFES